MTGVGRVWAQPPCGALPGWRHADATGQHWTAMRNRFPTLLLFYLISRSSAVLQTHQMDSLEICPKDLWV